MIIIEQNNGISSVLGNCLINSQIQVMGWNSHVVPLYKMIDELSPQLIIYGPEANMSGVAHIKQRFPSLALCYIGDFPSDETVADIVIGESSIRKSIPRPDRVYDITNIISGQKREEMLCNSISFTDSIKKDVDDRLRSILSYMISKDTRFFGSVRLESYNYLGILSEQEKSDVIASCSIYIDVTGDYWHKAVMAGCPAIVFSEKEIPGVLTFTDIVSLDNVWKKAQQDKYYLKTSRQEILGNTGHDLCITLFTSIGSSEAVKAIDKSKGEIV